MSTVRICLPCDAANGTNDFATADACGLVWTPAGASPVFSNAFQRDGRNTLALRDAAIYLSSDQLAKLNYDNQSFRIRFWYRPVTQPTFVALVSGYNSYAGNNGFTLFANHSAGGANNRLTLAYNGGTPFGFPAMASTTTFANNTTYHCQFSVERVSSSSFVYRLFVNGNLEDSDTASTGIVRASRFALGATEGSSYGDYYLSDFDMLVGDHGETANFTPPAKVAGTLGGSVLDNAAAPAVRRIRVIPRTSDPENLQRILNSDAGGLWTIRVPFGEYNVTIEDDDAGTMLADVHFGRVTAV